MYDNPPIDIDRGANIINFKCFSIKHYQTAENQDRLCIQAYILHTKENIQRRRSY